MKSWELASIVLTGLAFAGAVATGHSNNTATVRGVAFDSLNFRPLSGAAVRIVELARTASSDTEGQFQFDSVPFGRYTFLLEHPALDSIGLTEITLRSDVAAATPPVLLAIPSFATLWRGACGGLSAPRDSGLVYGAIQEAQRRREVVNARVVLSWTDVGVSAKRLKHTRYMLAVVADSMGRYVACGVPHDVPLLIEASADSSLRGALSLPARPYRVQRRDLVLGYTDGRVSAIRGTVSTPTGEPIANARVAAGGVVPVRTDTAGKFIVREVALGTRSVDILAIGYKPRSRTVDVVVGDTADLSEKMERVTTLETVKVKATVTGALLRQFEERKIMGFGYFQDSSEIRPKATTSGMLGSFPTVRVHGLVVRLGSPGCVARLYIDQQPVDSVVFFALPVDEIAWLEVYPRTSMVPREFMRNRGVFGCGAIAATTKRGIGR